MRRSAHWRLFLLLLQPCVYWKWTRVNRMECNLNLTFTRTASSDRAAINRLTNEGSRRLLWHRGHAVVGGRSWGVRTGVQLVPSVQLPLQLIGRPALLGHQSRPGGALDGRFARERRFLLRVTSWRLSLLRGRFMRDRFAGVRRKLFDEVARKDADLSIQSSLPPPLRVVLVHQLHHLAHLRHNGRH